MKRVVVTGMAAISSMGASWEEMAARMEKSETGVRKIPEWEEYSGLRGGGLGAPISGWSPPEHFNRKVTRTMGQGSIYATAMAESAVRAAGLLDSPSLTDGTTGVAFGSCLGSSMGLLALAESSLRRSFEGIPASSFLRVMSHSSAANIAMYFKLAGRVLPLCSACTSATQSIGAAFESIRSGSQNAMIAGGADELCVAVAALFDSMAASSAGDPDSTPRPFDRARTGLVVSEGAGAFVLEDFEHASARGAEVIAELVGYSTNSNGGHITNPDPHRMREVMEQALKCAGISPRAIGVIHAHATGTELGDIAESIATYDLFGDHVPVTAFKGYLGHALGACGAIESLLMIEMMRRGEFAPIRNLVDVDERCRPLRFIKDKPLVADVEYVMVNTFAFGGVNTSVIWKRA